MKQKTKNIYKTSILTRNITTELRVEVVTHSAALQYKCKKKLLIAAVFKAGCDAGP